MRRVIAWQLSGEQPRDLRLAWRIDQAALAALEEEIFGKHVLITSHDDWPVAEVVAGYRSQSEAEFSFRQMKDPHVVSFSPMFHWTEHNIRVHMFTCVLALQIAHLMRLKARRAGLDLSVRALLGELAGIDETILLYQAERGLPGPTACSPTPHRSRTSSAASSASAATRPGADMGKHQSSPSTTADQGNKTKINIRKSARTGRPTAQPVTRPATGPHPGRDQPGPDIRNGLKHGLALHSDLDFTVTAPGRRERVAGSRRLLPVCGVLTGPCSVLKLRPSGGRPGRGLSRLPRA